MKPEERKRALNISFFEKCKAGDLEGAKELLAVGADLHAGEEAALWIASEKGYGEIVSFLLENGADLHALDDRALRSACGHGRVDVARLLLARGANAHANEDDALLKAADGGFQGQV